METGDLTEFSLHSYFSSWDFCSPIANLAAQSGFAIIVQGEFVQNGT